MADKKKRAVPKEHLRFNLPKAKEKKKVPPKSPTLKHGPRPGFNVTKKLKEKREGLKIPKKGAPRRLQRRKTIGGPASRGKWKDEKAALLKLQKAAGPAASPLTRALIAMGYSAKRVAEVVQYEATGGKKGKPLPWINTKEAWE